MKQAKPFLIAAILTLCALGTITYTSCTKDNKCTNSCLNGGICSNQTCVCPTGFTGDNCASPAPATITYTNDTYTPVTIIANGVTSTIPVGGSISYSGLYGNPLNASAYTNGVFAGKKVGEVITWNLSKIFPATGAASYGVDVNANYFFLRLQNNSNSYNAASVLVNYATSYQTDDTVAIPHDRTTYDIGYYYAFNKTKIYVNAASGSGGTFWSIVPFTFTTFTENQTYTFSFN